MKPEYYFLVADQMLLAATTMSNGLTERTAATRVLRLGCKALEQVCIDMQDKPMGDLYWAMLHFDELRKEYRERKSADPLQAIRAVLDSFLVAETTLFEKAKVPPYVRSFILGQAEDLMSNLDVLPEMNLEEWQYIRDNVNKFKEEVCVSEQVLLLRDQFDSLMKKGAYILGGAGVIKLNALTDVVTTLGLLPWMTVLSGKLGSMMMLEGGQL